MTATAQHPLAPLPQRLAKLLVNSTDPALASKVEAWMGRQSNGLYHRLSTWLDAEENIDLRRTLGTRVCEIIESENLAALEE